MRPKTQRRLSSERLREHVLQLARVHGATRLHVLDEMVNVSARHFEALLSAVEEADVRFDVPNGMRADYLERDHVRRMRGRVTTLSVSAESGVQRVVDRGRRQAARPVGHRPRGRARARRGGAAR